MKKPALKRAPLGRYFSSGITSRSTCGIEGKEERGIRNSPCGQLSLMEGNSLWHWRCCPCRKKPARPPMPGADIRRRNQVDPVIERSVGRKSTDSDSELPHGKFLSDSSHLGAMILSTTLGHRSIFPGHPQAPEKQCETREYEV